MSQGTPAWISEVRTVGVPVTDQGRALDFYVDRLGFEIRLDVPYGNGGRWVEVAPPGAVTTIALVPAHDGVPSGVETGIRLVATDADAVHAALKEGGVDADDVLRWEGAPPMFAFRDQDGNGLEIVEAGG
jgi:catechol 2,3-dioxygenase-like lactoylglutathione lyase family enzyme